jgi:hypothetical protein
MRSWAGGVAGASFLLAVAACTSSGGAPGMTSSSDTCAPYTSDADLSAPVYFAANVAPIFMTNCTGAGVGCHGAGFESPFLADADGGGADAAAILESIVGVEAGEDPEMDFIAPNQPGQSFLMHKMDGDQCTLSDQCALSMYNDIYPDCGSSMPLLPHALLPTSVRDQVRAWIAQGAQNN